MILDYVAIVTAYDNDKDRDVLNKLRNDSEWNRIAMGSGKNGTYEKYSRDFNSLEVMDHILSNLGISK